MKTAKQTTLTKLPPVSEKEFQKQVIDLAHHYKWKIKHDGKARVRKNGKDTYRTIVHGDPGAPDLTLARDQRCYLVECKTDVGVVAKEQMEWLIASGGKLWRPKHWPEIERFLRCGE